MVTTEDGSRGIENLTWQPQAWVSDVGSGKPQTTRGEHNRGTG